jgi:hypothetical protein
MEVTRGLSRTKLFLLAGAMIGCWADDRLQDFPSTDVTMRAIGERLGRSRSERELTAIASRGDAVLRNLRPRERAALARGYLRFKVDRPVVVDVAVPTASKPFWIDDQGFLSTDLVLQNADTTWQIYRKSFPAGTVGLGVNGLDRTLVAHYVVFVRARNELEPGHRPPMVIPCDRESMAWKITPAGPGISAARDCYKPFKALPRELAGAIMLQPAHGDRHSALLARGRVWKTRVVSSEHPSQITIAFGSDPARELVWTWTTSPGVDLTRLRIRRDPARNAIEAAADGALDGLSCTRVVTGESTVVEVHDLLNDPVIRRHRVAVDRLDPSTFYEYSLGEVGAHAWGPWRTVKSAPDRSEGVRFLYLGDAQTGLERWGQLLRAAVRRHPDTDFILLAGDLVDRGNERTNWDHFFLRAAAVFDQVPLMPCVGNHEYLDVGPRLYRAFFELPRNGPGRIDSDLVYHFETGDACFAVLDSTLAAFDPGAATRQRDWLDAIFTRTSATWKFVILHHPIYPSHPWRDAPALRDCLVPIFDKHHVDFVLQGHDHAYQRTYPMRGHRRAETPAEGTIYLMAVSGDKFVDHTRRDYVEVGRTGISTYQTFEIDPSSNRLTFRAWTEDGTVVDELAIAKAATTDLKAAAASHPAHSPGIAHRDPAPAAGAVPRTSSSGTN